MEITIDAVGEEQPESVRAQGAEPCTLVIFGAGGDLTRRKLIPALYHLSRGGLLAEGFTLLGVDREPMDNLSFRRALETALRSAQGDAHFDAEHWNRFAQHLAYLPCDLTNRAEYRILAGYLEKSGGGMGNRLYYCATPPSLVPSVVDGLGSVDLASEANGWARIVIEKPFGRDLASARALSDQVAGVFHEHQVYRIDHYLGKETVQNILVFRFGNALFEPVWNRNHIDYVEITAAETLGIGHRGGYYDQAGALRDMMTNHLMQLLALVAMEPPIAFDADAVRDQKVQVWRSIVPMSPEQVAARTVRGQYTAGHVHGAAVAGYREEVRVAAESLTGTYAAAEFRIENWRWAGVPFYLRTGKRLARAVTELALHFKRPPQALFADKPGFIAPNVIVLRIQPDEGIEIGFGAKQPGTPLHTTTVHMDFCYQRAFRMRLPDAYETLLLDAMNGDATLFTRRDGVEAQWRLIDPILAAWENGSPDLHPYAAGSEGPADAEPLPARNGHRWRALAASESGCSGEG